MCVNVLPVSCLLGEEGISEYMLLKCKVEVSFVFILGGWGLVILSCCNELGVGHIKRVSTVSVFVSCINDEREWLLCIQ